ncbi:endo alpha-1,4 polygalactosaminidase [Aeromicrobium sp. Leaf350]|uniref:endo alpha-1,4 polygalactosaminidase n=1 Tax=Aeromicrobium sp. Leaf350 TaxID=2876565 RepID=UPI001E2F38DD|nr:endo alpha-1,4 polygalactosaminidase [Aeromicrobium sp. Leaf350]
MRWLLPVLLLALTACGAGSDDAGLTLPPVGAVVDYQLGGRYEPADDVDVVTRDKSSVPDPDRYSICYVNGFQTQPGGARDVFVVQHGVDLLLQDAAGDDVIDPGWPEETLFDIGTPEKRTELAEVVGDWIRTCANDGFDAVEVDNLDSWTRSQGLLDQGDAEAFAALLVEAAHDAGVPIGQKNAAELDGAALGFDFAVTEECAVYDECDVYTDMYGGHVIEIEYTDNGLEAFEEACADAAGDRSILLRDRDVVPDDDPAYVYEHC